MHLVSALLVSMALASGAKGSTTSAPVLERVADVPLPGPPVRFDYQSIDTTANRLYISHMNAGDLVVFNLNSRSVETTVSELPRTTGVWSVPALGKVYASVPGHHHVAVIDAHTLRVEARVGRRRSHLLRLGTFGFGGPIALAGYMQRDLVDRRR